MYVVIPTTSQETPFGAVGPFLLSTDAWHWADRHFEHFLVSELEDPDEAFREGHRCSGTNCGRDNLKAQDEEQGI